MYKLTTNLAFFKFKNDSFSKGNVPIDWYVLDEDEEVGRPFSHDELNQFKDYVVSNEFNFPGKKNYSNSSEDEAPYCGIETALVDDNLVYPELFILRPEPIPLIGNITKCVDVILTDQNGSKKHDYALPFNVIGKVVS